jgi:hypothetical protein
VLVYLELSAVYTHECRPLHIQMRWRIVKTAVQLRSSGEYSIAQQPRTICLFSCLCRAYITGNVYIGPLAVFGDFRAVLSFYSYHPNFMTTPSKCILPDQPFFLLLLQDQQYLLLWSAKAQFVVVPPPPRSPRAFLLKSLQVSLPRYLPACRLASLRASLLNLPPKHLRSPRSKHLPPARS